MKLKYDARIHKIVNGKIVSKTVTELIEDEKRRAKARNELSAMGIKITAY
jgi:macrodomain Ter protein organizer (MatP/YcbG family)